MKWSWFGRIAMALLSAVALGLGMTACGGGTIAYLWSVNQQFSQIHGYKVDDYTGNLTAVQNSPFSANGAVPVYILVKPGGRYVYVVNQGTACPATVTSTTAACTGPTSNSNDSGIAVFSVGGDGALTYQLSYPTQGFKHLWAAFDGTGNYLFVLDEYSPSGDGNGAITTFTVDPNTGRLSLDPQTASVAAGSSAPTYLEVGANPLRLASTSSCLFTVNQADQSVTPYTVGTGQLTPVTTGKIFPGTNHISSIAGNSTYILLTDSGSNMIYPFTVSTACGLTPFGGGPIANVAGDSDPVNSLISNSNAFVYILNGASTSTNSTTSYSTISAFNILTSPTTELSDLSGGDSFSAGAGPSCMVEDPTQKYMYTSNFNDGSITGYAFDNVHGTLSTLSRGSTFTTNDTGAACLALSASVD